MYYGLLKWSTPSKVFDNDPSIILLSAETVAELTERFIFILSQRYYPDDIDIGYVMGDTYFGDLIDRLAALPEPLQPESLEELGVEVSVFSLEHADPGYVNTFAHSRTRGSQRKRSEASCGTRGTRKTNGL